MPVAYIISKSTALADARSVCDSSLSCLALSDVRMVRTMTEISTAAVADSPARCFRKVLIIITARQTSERKCG